MKKAVIPIAVLVCVLLLATFRAPPDQPQSNAIDFVKVHVFATEGGEVKQLEIAGAPEKSSERQAIVTALAAAARSLREDAEPQIKFRVDSQTKWSELKPILAAAAETQSESELIIVADFVKEPFPETAVRLQTSRPSSDTNLPDLEVLIRHPESGAPANLVLRIHGNNTELGTGPAARQQLSENLFEMCQTAGAKLSQQIVVEVSPEDSVPFSEVFSTLIHANNHGSVRLFQVRLNGVQVAN